MKMKFISIVLTAFIFSGSVLSGDYYVSGKITSIKADANEPAIRLSGNVSPDKCLADPYGWLFFKGTAEEKNRVYSTALALSIVGKRVTVYTNMDATQCRIENIQVLDMDN